MKSKLPKGKAGFTLPEMVIAAVIMAIGLSVFAATLSMSSKAVYSARDQLVAMNYARYEVERKRDLVYGDPALAVGTTTLSNSLYTGSLVVSYVGTSTSKLKKVTAIINWRNNSANVATNLRFSAVMSSSMH